MNLLQYNPITSFCNYLRLKMKKEIKYLLEFNNHNMHCGETGEFEIFLSMQLQQNNENKRGNVIFQIIFACNDVNKVIKYTKYTIPFFAGLPGFCSKHFMVNKEKLLFSGYYEWDRVESATNYARSFACKIMQRVSSPYEIRYRIIDKETGSIVEEYNWIGEPK